MNNKNSLEYNLLLTYYRVQRYRFIFLTIGVCFALLAFFIIFKSICWNSHENFLMAAACPLKNGFGIVALGLGCYSLWIACEMEVEKEAVRNTCAKACARLNDKGAFQDAFDKLEELKHSTMLQIDQISHMPNTKTKEKQRLKRVALEHFMTNLNQITG